MTLRMAYDHQQRAALRILDAIEDGKTSNADAFALIEPADPALIYLLLTWLRNHYTGHAAGDAVLGRLGTITSAYPAIAKKMKEGQADSIVEWFEDAYSYREFDAKAFVALVVDKLES